MLNRGDLSQRADPNYHSLFREVSRRLSQSAFPVSNLGKFTKLMQYGSSSLATSEKIGVPMIRMNNLKGDELDLSDLKYIEMPERELSLYLLRKGDLLFNRTNSKELVGKCAVFREDEKYVFASYLIRVRLNENSLLLEFAAAFLGTSTGRMQIDCISRQIIGMTNINTEEIRNLKLPVPPIETQKNAVGLIGEAKEIRKWKEAEAKRLLESVDAYVLERLGISLPVTAEDALAKRVFYANSGQVLGGRFDAPSHSSTLSLSSSTFPMIRFKDYIEINPYTSFAHLPGETLLSFVPMESISDLYGEITGTHTRAASESKGYTLFQEGDILWAKITPCMQNGKSALAKGLLNGFGFGSTEYHVFRVSNLEVNPSYVFALLRLKHLRNEAVKFFSGSAGHQRVDVDLFKRLLIPLPPLNVQDEIVAHIEDIYAEAKRLRREGRELLERAKREVEAMILGAPNN